MLFIRLRTCPSAVCWEILPWMNVLNDFSVCIKMILWFPFLDFNVMNYIDWFYNVEPALHDNDIVSFFKKKSLNSIC